jgi:iron complex outermembrane receptor protein
MRTKPCGAGRSFSGGGLLALILMLTVLQLDAAAAEKRFALTIPSLPVASAIKSLSYQTGHSVLFLTDDVEAIHTNAIEGRYTLRDALDALLRGSSLTGGLTESGVITISLAKEQGQNRETAMVKGRVRKSFFGSLATILLGGTAGAQDAAQAGAGQPEAPAASVEEVVVVGTQIRGANIADSLPVTLLDRTDIDALAPASGEEIFRFLPSQGGMAFSGDKDAGGLNSARGDVGSINLRSLGTGNALVLLNGRRMVLHPGTQAEGGAPVVTPNLNSLPTGGISRIEVLRDGASAIYGADAVAGVINTVLRDEFEGFEFTTRYGDYAGVDAGSLSLNGYGGVKLNEGRTSLTVFGSFYDRDGITSRDRPYSANEDKRPLVVGTEFEGDSQLNNTSTSGPWGQFVAAQPVRQNGTLLTSSAGIFHVQPTTLAGCRASLGTDICMDDGSADAALRYNRANTTQPGADLERFNAFAFARHELGNGRELYGELSWYRADSTKPRDGSPLQAAVPITIAASAYYNPFGAVLLPDGSPNPNRLPNIDAPAEGLNLVVGGANGRYAIIDGGPRFANVRNTSYRGLAGIRGEAWGDWEFDSAILYSGAETNDVSPGSVSNTLFQQALNRTTPDAYNPFNGGNVNDLSGLDTTANPQSVLDTFLVTARRDSTTSLLLADFKLSHSSLFDLPAGNLSAAFGIEGRRETYEDDRDPRLDETLTFTDSITGEVFETDVLGQSGTLDTKGDRNTFSAFMEVYMPLLSREQGIPLAQSMDLQLAARYEHASDFGGVLVPKAALSWRPFDSLQIRTSYAEGFRAPNLEVVNAELLVRGNDSTDWYRCQAQLNLGTIPSLSACSQVQRVFSTRSGNRDLDPESSRTYSIGAVIQPTVIPSLTLTVDYYDIEQEDVVGIAGDDVQVALDFVRRLNGANNPAIIRADPTPDDVAFFAGSGLAPAGAIISLLDPYFNIESRASRGLEFGIHYELRDTPIGDLGFSADASHLLEFEQKATANAVEIRSEPLADSIVLPGSGSLVEREGYPEWRGLARATWNKGNLGLGVAVSYIGSFFDTSTTQDQTGALFPVDEWITTNVYLQYSLGDSIRIRLGANNVTDEDPPLADEEHGYYTDYHDNRGRLLYGELRVAF